MNRLLARYLGEVLAAIDEGTPIEEADRALDPLGLPMSPMTLLALVGPAVALHTAETMHAAFPDRFAVSDNAGRLVESGKSGVYLWDGGTPTVDPEVRAIFKVGTAPSTADQVRERALAALASEIRIMLDEGVVAAPQDVDLCLILGRGLAVPPGRGHAFPRSFRRVRTRNRRPVPATWSGVTPGVTSAHRREMSARPAGRLRHPEGSAVGGVHRDSGRAFRPWQLDAHRQASERRSGGL